jgi:hypothetical protein
VRGAAVTAAICAALVTAMFSVSWFQEQADRRALRDALGSEPLHGGTAHDEDCPPHVLDSDLDCVVTQGEWDGFAAANESTSGYEKWRPQ